MRRAAQLFETSGYGEVFTRRWVVEMVLDLAGYTADHDLGATVALEPACGGGAFLVPMVERLALSCRAHSRTLSEVREAVRAFDLLERNVTLSRKAVAAVLVASGMVQDDADNLAGGWVTQGDFLDPGLVVPGASWVLGNPPYVRLEDIDDERLPVYRSSWPTMRGRADLFVGFIERGLRTLVDGGVLGFIVADRWLHNQYGSELRKMIADRYAVEALVQVHEADAFEVPVSAYPAVTVIRRRRQGKPVVARAVAGFEDKAAVDLVNWSRGRGRARKTSSYEAVRLNGWFPGDELWPMGDPATLALVKDLEDRFPPLEDPTTGTRVGIGVATGAERAYITDAEDLVEADRLLPLAMGEHTTTGALSWGTSPRWLVNPWDNGRLVDLASYPRLAAHFERHRGMMEGRHVAKKCPDRWYRTIDKVDPVLDRRPKLLFPDLKASIHPVLDPGGDTGLYPHHNLYWVTSSGWDIEVLGGLLLSEIANTFVGTYCVKMAGGCYRFQAQYLRRIRVRTGYIVTSKRRPSSAREGFPRARCRTGIGPGAQRLWDTGATPHSRRTGRFTQSYSSVTLPSLVHSCGWSETLE